MLLWLKLEKSGNPVKEVLLLTKKSGYFSYSAQKHVVGTH